MIYLVLCLLVLGSGNETTDEQPTENRHLDMNRDDYAKLHVILDCSSIVYRGLYGLTLLPNTNQLSEECLRPVMKHACTQLHKVELRIASLKQFCTKLARSPIFFTSRMRR